MTETDISDSRLQAWLTSECWFMRYLGVALLLIAVLSVFSGFFDNPNDESVLTVFNITIAILFAVASIWTMWSSFNQPQIQRMVDDFRGQPAKRQIVLAVVQIIASILFLLEGFRGRITLLFLGILLFTTAAWAFRRSHTIRQFQE
ncbi:MAG: hypothetical protein Q9P01_00030 [Anaerolineae bacterium]|nr:hypothetical protein [Anaerolineae bacterium]MDQ7033260.1 hypothetical protein [Anaerolineae bacterium]